MANYFSLQLSQMQRSGRPCAQDYRKTGRRAIPAPSQDTGCVEFVEQGGERAVVCRPEGVVEALEGRAGTGVVK